ncbi:MAG: hypothetical protein JO188_06995 [Hyphomicrobiales bacterium]|nr:hypothetical protein [Hyphomicrobiales bacterium]
MKLIDRFALSYIEIDKARVIPPMPIEWKIDFDLILYRGFRRAGGWPKAT